MKYMFVFLIALCVFATGAIAAGNGSGALIVTHSTSAPVAAKKATKAQATANSVLLVLAVPTPDVYTSVSSTFGNQRGLIDRAPRGGALVVKYADNPESLPKILTDDTVRNLTQEAGFGMTGVQGANGIAVRDVSLSFDATKALFSMVIGLNSSKWQVYEMTGFEQGQSLVITRVAGQPAGYNNIYPAYGTDGSIFFASDIQRDLDPTHGPPLDEYESAETTSGIWKLNPARTSFFQCVDSPSGDFNIAVAPDGRLIFTGWDHLKRDGLEPGAYGTFDYVSETGPRTSTLHEEFPESIDQNIGNVNHHDINIFQPWTVNQDCTSMETLNHIGQHELQGYANHSFNDDPNLIDLGPNGPSANRINNFLSISFDPNVPGRFIGVDAPEFYTDMAGGILGINGAIGTPADTMQIEYLTPRSGRTFYDTAPADFDGRYRRPQVLSDGRMIASYTPDANRDGNLGSGNTLNPRYKFRAYYLAKDAGGVFRKTTTILPAQITVNVTNNGQNFNGPLWEMDPVEVVARPVPPMTTTALQAPELAALQQAGVDPVVFQADMTANGLGLIVSRNVTTRDDADRQQPFNLKIANGGVQTLGAAGKIYTLQWLQIFQADAVRGLGGINNTDNPGRRRLARALHDPVAMAYNFPLSAAAPGSVALGQDGSMAAFVPSRRALTFQTTAPDSTPVVRERYWITLQPGEVRMCPSCHGVNTRDQAGNISVQNIPQALVQLATFWKTTHGGNPPPACVPPILPAPVTRPKDCPAGTTGTYQQTATYTLANPQVPPDGCYNLGSYLPVAPPSDSCPAIPPPPTFYRVSAKQGNQAPHIFPADASILANWPICGRVDKVGTVVAHWRCSQGTDVFDFPNANQITLTFVLSTAANQ